MYMDAWREALKRGTSRLLKTKDFARELKVELWGAVGILDLLWQFAAEVHPAGDVGRSPDCDIAEAISWKKSPILLVRAMVKHRWLDENPACRLLVHDWPEHCEDAVHSKMARGQKYFADGSAPRFTRLTGPEREKARVFFGEQALSVRTEGASSAQIERLSAPHFGHGMAKKGDVVSLGGAGGLADHYQNFLTLWQSPCTCCRMEFALKQVDLGCAYWMNLVDKGSITESTILNVFAGLERWRASEDWHREGGKWIPAVHVWLGASKDGLPSAPRWNDYPKAYQCQEETEKARY